MAPSVTFRSALSAFALVLLSACAAQNATARGMTIRPTDLSSPPSSALARSVLVTAVTGRLETHAEMSKIDDVSFREALVSSLREAEFLSESADAPLALSAHLASFKQPSILAWSWGFTVTTFVHYTVPEVRTGAVLLDDDIGAEHSQWFWPLLGYKRLQAANEGSARKNIAALIERMNQIRPAPAAAPSM